MNMRPAWFAPEVVPARIRRLLGFKNRPVDPARGRVTIAMILANQARLPTQLQAIAKTIAICTDNR